MEETNIKIEKLRTLDNQINTIIEKYIRINKMDNILFENLKRDMIMNHKTFFCSITKKPLDVTTSSIYQFFSKKKMRWIDCVLDNSVNPTITLRKVENIEDFKSHRVSESRYNEARNEYLGWCPLCAEFTTDQCEPDAEKYQCTDCGNKIVFGAENAVMYDLIEIR